MNQPLLSAALLLALVPTLAVGAEPGITKDLIVLGERSAFSGPSAGVGVEVWRGEQAAFFEVNDLGGVHDRRIKLALADDGYDAQKAPAAALHLLSQDRVFALFGGVGTAGLVKTLPVIIKHNQTDWLFQFSNISGSDAQREPPFSKAVFNVRASYRQETRAMVDAFVAMDRRRIGILVQDDAYGTSGRDGVRRALREHQLDVVADTTYPRGQAFQTSMGAQVKILRAAGVDAIICVGSYQASAAFIRDARVSDWDVPIHNVSFVGADQMLALVRKAEETLGRKLSKNLLATQVVPHYNDLQVPLVQQYRAAMNRYQPVAPSGVGDASYRPRGDSLSYGSLEGYLNARAFIAILEKAGRDLTRRRFIQTAHEMGQFDLGLGTPLRLSFTQHQALDRVWFTHVSDHGWEGTDNPTSAIH